jgi:hypothetical protein
MTQSEPKRPEGCEEEHLEYLDALRRRGDLNMYGAGPALASCYEIPESLARDILIYWMETFSVRQPD